MLDKFNDLFRSDTKQEGDNEDNGEGNTGSFDGHWGWFATLYSLSQTGILNITGETSITKLNIYFVFNYLAIDKDYKELERQATKAAMAKSNNRTRLK